MFMIEVQAVGLYIDNQPDVETTPVNELIVDCGGIIGGRHYGFTRTADGRTPEYEPGETISNTRQWTAIAPEELAAIAQGMGVERIDPAWVGANLCLKGIANLSQVPKGSKLRFSRDELGQQAVLVIEDQNMPCRGPGKVIASKYAEVSVKYYTFPKAAMIDKETSRRGVIGVVEHAGKIVLGAIAVVELYKPRAYYLP